METVDPAAHDLAIAEVSESWDAWIAADVDIGPEFDRLARAISLLRSEGFRDALAKQDEFLGKVTAVWRHIEQECDIAPGKGFIRLGECTDPALHGHLLEQEGEAWKRYRPTRS